MFLVPMDFFQSKAFFLLLILQNIFFCVQKKKETPTGLEQLEGVKYSIKKLKKTWPYQTPSFLRYWIWPL